MLGQDQSILPEAAVCSYQKDLRLLHQAVFVIPRYNLCSRNY